MLLGIIDKVYNSLLQPEPIMSMYCFNLEFCSVSKNSSGEIINFTIVLTKMEVIVKRGLIMGKLKEEKTIEFKQEFTPSFLKTVSAFANYDDGEIIFGISDDGEVVGIKNIDQLKLAIENAINDTIEPRPIFTLKETIMDNKEVLMLNVYKLPV